MATSGSRIPIAVVLVALLSSPYGGSSFPMTQVRPDARRAQALASRCRARPLHSTVDAPMRPMEHEKESDDRRGWKRVAGGFVPKFLKRGVSPRASQTLPSVEIVDTLEDYRRAVVEEDDRMVVVRYHASWCKSCKAAFPLFKKMVSEHSSSAVKFVEVPLTRKTAYIHEGLGVPSVPYGHIYHPEAGLVEEKKLNKKVFKEFREALDSYVRGSCDLPADEEEDCTDESESEFQ